MGDFKFGLGELVLWEGDVYARNAGTSLWIANHAGVVIGQLRLRNSNEYLVRWATHAAPQPMGEHELRKYEKRDDRPQSQSKTA